jgi:prophage regulatory protein
MNGMKNGDRYVTLNEVIERLHVCKASIYTWVKAGHFPKQKKFGTSSRWSLQEVEEWISTRPEGAYGEGK